MNITEKAVHAALDPVVSKISLSQWEKQRMVQVAMASGHNKKRHRMFVFRRVLAVAAAVAICFTTSMAVLASPALSDKLSKLSRQTLRYLSPVSVQSANNGISMEVLASMHDDNTIISYLSFTDTTGKNRLDQTMELSDILIDGEPFVITGEPMPQEDGSVVVRVQGLRDPVQAIGGKVTISVRTILSGAEVQPYTDTGITVGEIQRWNPQPNMSGTMPLQSSSCEIGSGKLNSLMNLNMVQCLKAYGSYVDDNIPFMNFQNAGIVDGALHVLARRDPDRWYDAFSLALFNEKGEQIPEDVAQLNVGAALENQNPASNCPTETVEYVMSLPEDADLDALSLWYTTSTYQHCITGNWNVTFNVPDEKQATVFASCNESMNGWTLRSVAISPFGVEAVGDGALLENSLIPGICLYLKDGTVIERFSSAITSAAITSSAITSVQSDMDVEEDQISCKYYFDEPLDIRELDSVTVQGKLIWKR